MGSAFARSRGIVRSLAMYYGQIWRHGRMERFYRQFLAPGDLAFDLGSHVGNRIGPWRRLGARVVAVEPQPDFARIIRWLHGRDPGVTLETCGVAARAGRGTLHISTLTPTVSTLSPAWIDDVTLDPRFASIDWDRRLDVPLRSLDELIDRYGEPRFCKIDVEGLELDVLMGLSRPLRALSFEYIPIAAARAAACIDRLETLARYRYRTSRIETMQFASPTWMDAAAMKRALLALDPDDRSGDVYALRDA
jgi:FkbM family methyltransferase